MGAECSKCGYDVFADEPCGYCEMQARAETAEAERDKLREALRVLRADMVDRRDEVEEYPLEAWDATVERIDIALATTTPAPVDEEER